MFVICGPKLSTCCMIISIWGAVMLSLVGLFFYIESPALLSDTSLTTTEFDGFTDEAISSWFRQGAYNCWITAGVYAVTLGISVQQRWARNRAQYSIY